ncbi:hypothetical protein SAMN02745751_01737 [Dethiosulfatibacter aminovorans DSM 17477]|uniref:Uncharacterized protein n=1 Tax=Dethiosulfatibacter aminovorans DSM 17477 TaxID=1121476 RepID=A0A1M6GFX8_9FIRM|nr:hypothetical protein [Dethiosulfatibacter aminovorans]SHJ08837.1 hypothetical protein SAMN02745751_01737 [Dethiosulfatibacter aminovorans DSM 17477]
MGDKEYRLKCLNRLSELSKHRKTSQKEGLLDLFVTYVYLTNPDYKYNETYLKDMIPKFWINVEKYNLKVELREKMLKEIQKKQIPEGTKCQLCIQVDDTWELRFDNTAEGSIGKWIRTMSEIPRLNSVDNKKTYIKCQFNNGQGSVFSDYLVSDDNVKLIKFAADSVKSYIDRLGD